MWAQVKSYVTNKTQTSTNSGMKNLTPEAVDKMQIFVWNGCMQHTDKIETAGFL
jgi:hypothetical protein